ncbi:oligosaccharide flippase family protein [Comamonas sp. lk]|uniref:lipopolysaccharide biosynthesis protein n=1 Tax=Comamonas sp. lk TaxID=2201272 RepID=UPI000EAE339C|nr:oligosaccharide flippase family protein [Comamonas sp. lk]
MRKLFPKSAYTRNVLTLMTGTGLAQAIPIAISPILTRLYSPEEFGLFALYMSVVSILAVMVTGRYELAIVLPKRDRDAMHIVMLSIMLSFFVSIILFVIIWLFNARITNLLKVPEISPWLYWMPLSTLLMGTYQSLSYWSNRKAQYKRLAISRTAQGSSTALLQLSSGSMTSEGAGLIEGDIGGRALSCAVLAKSVFHEDKKIILNINKKRIFLLARKYLNFPKYLIFAHGINAASFQLPNLFLGALFNSAAPGFFALTQRVMGAPSALVAGALGDVFRQQASHYYVCEKECAEIFINTLKKLLLLSFFPFVIFFFFAPDLFSFIFGQKWEIAGVYAQILTPMFFMQFVASPLSVMFMIGEKQKIDLMWQVILFTAVFFSLRIGGYYFDVFGTLIIFSSVYSLMYFLSLIISYKIAKGGFAHKQ